MFLTASYLRNRGPLRDLPLTPQEMWSGVRPSISHLRAYGCKVYCPIDKMQRGGKLGQVRYVGVLVGYVENIPSYRVCNPLKAKKVANVGGAEFDESVGKAWWRGGLGVEDLADMEVVIFPDAEGDEDAPAAWRGWATLSRPTGGWDGEFGGR